MRTIALVAIILLFSGLLFTGPARAGGWPEIPESERSLASVPSTPEATAVVLLQQGHLELSQKTLSSFLDVYRRVKVLKPEGREYGTVSLFSSDFYRMKDLEARVHVPGGKTLDLGKDAKFEKKVSKSYGRAIVTLVMPEVEPGAIVEYRYRVYFDSILYPEPWYFQDVIPTQRSEISCAIPKSYAFKPYLVKTVNRQVSEDVKGSATGTRASYALSDVPPVPSEPGGPPFEDLATRVTFLPIAVMQNGKVPLLESWDSYVKLVEGDRTYGYEFTRKHAFSAGQRGKSLAESAASAADKAAAIVRYVRDEIGTEPFLTVGGTDRKGDEILGRGKGMAVEKALLCQIMLDGADIPSSIAWTRTRDSGQVDPGLVNPGQFDTVLVVADLDGKRTFLDVADRSVAFGALPPNLEQVPCLLVDRKAPEWVTTPQTAADGSAREAALDLEVSASGAVGGKGSLALTGHHAWEKLDWKDTKEERQAAWKEWLASKLPGYDVADVTLSESVDERKVGVTWRMTARTEEVNGREASVSVAAPLAQEKNPFTLPPERRLTPVRVPFPDSDRLTLTVKYPESWRIESRPNLRRKETSSGALVTEMKSDEGARTVTIARRLDVKKTSYGLGEYGDLRSLCEAAVANDAEVLVLAKK